MLHFYFEYFTVCLKKLCLKYTISVSFIDDIFKSKAYVKNVYNIRWTRTPTVKNRGEFWNAEIVVGTYILFIGCKQSSKMVGFMISDYPYTYNDRRLNARYILFCLDFKCLWCCVDIWTFISGIPFCLIVFKYICRMFFLT